MRKLATSLVLVLTFASAAHAKCVVLIGDSLMWGSDGGTSNRSRMEPGKLMQGGVDLLPASHPYEGAQVINVGVSATTPSDWVGPVLIGLCAIASGLPTIVGEACAAGDGLADHIPVCEACILLVDGSEVQQGSVSASDQVDDEALLILKLQAQNCTETLILASPTLQRTYVGSTNTGFDDMLAEMESRDYTMDITWSPRLLADAGSIHLTDIAYVQMADSFLRALPTPTPAPTPTPTPTPAFTPTPSPRPTTILLTASQNSACGVNDRYFGDGSACNATVTNVDVSAPESGTYETMICEQPTDTSCTIGFTFNVGGSDQAGWYCESVDTAPCPTPAPAPKSISGGDLLAIKVTDVSGSCGSNAPQCLMLYTVP